MQKSRSRIFFAVVAVAAANLSTAAAPKPLNTVAEATSTFVVASGTDEHNAALHWLKQRQAEGQYVDGPTAAALDLNQVTTPLTLSVSHPLKTRIGQGGVEPDLYLPDPSPGQLPDKGIPGQKTSISSCVPGGQSFTYTYQWDPSANKGAGGWVLVKVVYQAAVTTCD